MTVTAGAGGPSFPDVVEVSDSGSGSLDGVYTLGEATGGWGLVYRKSGEISALSLRYGEGLAEVGGADYVGWVIGNFDHAKSEISARCVRNVKSEGSGRAGETPQWEVCDAVGNFIVFPGFKARPMGLSVAGGRVTWRLGSLREKLKLCSPGEGVESEIVSLAELAGEYKLVLYPFGSPQAAPGCVSLALARTGGTHRILRFYMRIGNCESGHKIMAGSEFAVDFSRAAISGRLETLEAELNIVL